ncbi:hypothetical protein MKEN_00191500 [Mycena kentingensis (nom. inval.)]|nr:hypothetical protein MKEN_00191500 [Mycena kentingensis (nom. inval.)]
MDALDRLPQELWDAIVGALYGNRAALHTCTLIARPLSTSATPLLYRKILINFPTQDEWRSSRRIAQLKKLLRALKLFPHLLQHIRGVVVVSCPSHFAADIAAVGWAASTIRELSIGGMTDAEASLNAMKRLLSIPTLRILRIDNLDVHFGYLPRLLLHCPPGLERFSFTHTKWNRDPWPGPLRKLEAGYARPKIQSLVLGGCIQPIAATFADANFLLDLSGVRVLRFNADWVHPELFRVLEVCGDSVEDLRMSTIRASRPNALRLTPFTRLRALTLDSYTPFIADLLPTLASSVSTTLRTITISFLAFRHLQAIIDSLSEKRAPFVDMWARLDEASERLAVLESVSIRAVVEAWRVQKDVLPEQAQEMRGVLEPVIRSCLWRLHARGALVFCMSD